MNGVRILSHQETPGLGDKIELAKSNWITSFSGKTLMNESDSRWAVTKDGGMFDQFTGATITPRAVVNAVKKATLYFLNNQNDLFSQKNDCKVNDSFTEIKRTQKNQTLTADGVTNEN